MLINFPGCHGMGMTNITISSAIFGTTFVLIPPVKNQVGVALWVGTTGIEIAGAGMSYGPQGFTLIGGVTNTLNFMNANGSSLKLVANGNGLPLFNAMFAPISFAGAPQLWLTAGTTNLTVRVTYLYNDAFSNQ